MGILIIFFTGLRDIERTINNGTFDRLLLRPRGVLFQVIASNADWFAALGHGGLGIVLLSFYIMKSSNMREVFYWNMRKFAVYPISIFPKLIQYIMIYVIPFAFVNYFPAQYLLRKEDMAAYPEIFMYISPIVGVCLYLLAYLFWRYSLRHYVSSGN